MGSLVVRVVAAAAVLFGAAAMVALIIAPDDEIDSDLVARSVDVARDARTARAIFTFALDAPPGFEAEAVSFGGEVEFDFARDRSRAVFSFTDALGGDALDPPVPEELEMELLVDDETVYLRAPALRAAVPEAPGDWFAAEMSELSRATGESSLGLGAIDPTQTLEYLRGASSAVEEVADERVRDVETTHHRVAVDLERAVAATAATHRPLVSDAVAQFRSQFGTTRFPVDIWIDDDGLPRRLRFELDLADHDPTRSTPEATIMSFTMELFDYGQPVDIEPPPAEHVRDLTVFVDRVPTPSEPS